jgi:hypothetical protein
MSDIVFRCTECKQCNTRGKPSVMRGSAFCDSHRRFGEVVNRSGLFSRFKDFLFDRRAEYDDETGKLKDVNEKGFRPSWFWR